MKVKNLIKALERVDPKAEIKIAYQYEVFDGDSSVCDYCKLEEEDISSIFSNGKNVTVLGTSVRACRGSGFEALL